MSRRSAVPSIIASVLLVGTAWLTLATGAIGAHKPKEPPACYLITAAQAKSILASIDKLGNEAECSPGSTHASAGWTLEETPEQLHEGVEVPEGGFELRYYFGEPEGFLAGIGLREWGLEFCLGDQSGPAKKVSGLGRLAFYCPADGSIEVQQGETVRFLSTRESEPPPPESTVAKVMKSVLGKLGR